MILLKIFLEIFLTFWELFCTYFEFFLGNFGMWFPTPYSHSSRMHSCCTCWPWYLCMFCNWYRQNCSFYASNIWTSSLQVYICFNFYFSFIFKATRKTAYNESFGTGAYPWTCYTSFSSEQKIGKIHECWNVLSCWLVYFYKFFKVKKI